MNHKHCNWSISSVIVSTAILLSVPVINANIANPYGISSQFAFQKQFSEQIAEAIEKGASFEEVQNSLLQLIGICDLSSLFVSWKLAHQKPREHKKNLEDLRAYCLQLHPDKQEDCDKLIDAVRSVITGGQTATELKNNELMPDELEVARSFRKLITTVVRTILQQGGEPESICNYIAQSFNCQGVKDNAEALEQNRALFRELIKVQKTARQSPQIHRSCLASLLEHCIKARPEQRENCKLITNTMAFIYCGNPEEKLIDALAQQIPSHKKEGVGSMLPNINQSNNLQKIAKHFPNDNLKDQTNIDQKGPSN